MAGDIPAGAEDQEIGEWGGWVARWGSQNAEDGWIDVVNCESGKSLVVYSSTVCFMNIDTSDERERRT